MPVKTSSSHHPGALCFPGLVIRRTEIRNNVVLTLLNLHFSVLAGHSGGLETTQKGSNKSEQSDALCRDHPLSSCRGTGEPLLSCCLPAPIILAALLHLSCWPIWSRDERLPFNSGFVCLWWVPIPVTAAGGGSDAADLIPLTAG